MSAETVVYGASDDLIEIEGQIREEFSPGEPDVVLGFSDGTVLRIRFTNDGVWRITTLAQGSSSLTIVQAPVDDDDIYSDRATLTGEVRWVLCGDRYKTVAR